MKRYRYILFILFVILSCQSEIDDNDLGDNTNENVVPMSFYAGIEIPQDSSSTKTILDGTPSDALRNVLWEYQDEVYVTNGFQSSKFTNTSQGTSEIALLEGSLGEGTDYYAAYPFNMVTEYSSSNFTMDLPAKQTYYENGIDSEAFPMVAQCEDGVFNFKNICGILVVKLLGEHTITSISFSGKDADGNYLSVSGKGTVKMNYSDVPTLVMNHSSSDTSVTLSCIKGVKLNSSTPTFFHIVLPAGIYNSFVLNITADDGSMMFIKSKTTLNIKRSMRTTATALDFVPSVVSTYIDEYGINQGLGVDIDGVVWAPVNCGYHKTDFKYGKLYQWGRKYGQGYNGALYDMNGNEVGTCSDSSVPIIESGTVVLSTAQAKSNEDYFYKGTPYCGWISSINAELWNFKRDTNHIKTEYDPCPSGWRIPTYLELKNLCSNMSSWTTKDGQLGYWFSGSEYYSSSVPRVFFPAAGYRSYGGNAYGRGRSGSYWSSEYFGNNCSFYLEFDKNSASMDYFSYADGRPVRCVKYDGESISVSTLTFDATSLLLEVNEQSTLSATISPSNATHQLIHWWSDDPSVAAVDQNGKLKAISVGTTTITAMAGMQTTTCKVTVTSLSYIDEYGINQGPGVEIDDVIWAPVNCGYHEIDFRYGKLYQWGRRYGQGYNGVLYDVNYENVGTYSDSFVPTIELGSVSLDIGQSKSNEAYFYEVRSFPYDWLFSPNDKLWNSGTEYSPIKTEFDPCPSGWRVPTYKELDNLRSNMSSVTTKDGQVGYWLSGSESYSSFVPRVFFPAAGELYGSYALGRGSVCSYWSSHTLDYFAVHLSVFSGSMSMGGSHRYKGFSVRCVQE